MNAVISCVGFAVNGFGNEATVIECAEPVQRQCEC
jgi:hypothetical protein